MTGTSTRLAIETPLWDSLLAANAYPHKAALVQFALLPPALSAASWFLEISHDDTTLTAPF